MPGRPPARSHQGGKENHQYARGDCHVGHVEDSGLKHTETEVHKIGHRAVDDPIEKISDTAAHDKANSDESHGCEILFSEEVRKRNRQHHAGQYREQHEPHTVGPVVTETQKSAGVFNSGECEMVGEQTDGMIGIELLPHDAF